MSSYSLPPINGLPSLTAAERANILDALFEPCTALHTLCLESLGTQTFKSYNDLISSVSANLMRLIAGSLPNDSLPSDIEWLDRILGAHPRLGEKKVDSAQSRAEQAQLNMGGGDEIKQLKDLNDEYERAFPGLRYVVFVNGRTRPVIMENMRERIDRGDMNLERMEAIQAMCEIAADRAKKLQTP